MGHPIMVLLGGASLRASGAGVPACHPLFPLPWWEGVRGRGKMSCHPHPNPPPSRGREFSLVAQAFQPVPIIL